MGLRFPLLLDGEAVTSLQEGDVVAIDSLGKYTFERDGKLMKAQRGYGAPLEESWTPDGDASISRPETPIGLALNLDYFLREIGDEVTGKRWTVERHAKRASA